MKRVAVIVPGGVGEPDSPERIPALAGLLERLGETIDLTVYSLAPLQRNDRPPFRLVALNAAQKGALSHRLPGLLNRLLTEQRRHRYQLVHGFWGLPAGFLAVLWGKLSGVPSLVSLQGGEAACLPEIGYGNMYHPWQRRLTLWVCRKAKTLTALTHFQVQGLRRFGLERPVAVIPYGAGPAFFLPLKKPPASPFQFLQVGNITAVKDQETLLEVFAEISRHLDSRLRIVGPDYAGGAAQRRAEHLGIAGRVDFMGKIPYSQLPAQYARAHLLLHTALYEGQGVVFAEAAAAGVVVAGTRVGLLADWGGDRAITAPVQAPKQLAAAVLELLHSPDRYAERQRRARRWAEQHDLNWTVRQYQQLYQIK